jgi:hypothetical protein
MKTILAATLVLLTSCTQDILGLSRGDRLGIYGWALTTTGNPEFGAPVSALGRHLKTLDKQPRNVNPSGK